MPKRNTDEEELDAGQLASIPVNLIRPNPENPRLKFRAGELEELQESIRRLGVQVPISVFRSGDGYVLIDGERRWRCASKLNLKTIPALVRQEPDPLQNILLMFNIHMLREQWDLLTIALKLPKIVALYEKKYRITPTEPDLATHTGLKRGVIRKCRLLANLPGKYIDVLLAELDKPKGRQQVGEEFFVEMEKALATIQRNYPDIVQNVNVARDTLLKKYRARVIDSNIEFRKLAKIARSSVVGVDAKSAKAAIRRVLTEDGYSIDKAWGETVSEAYAERDILTRIDSLLGKLGELEPDELDDDVRKKLQELITRATAILEAGE
jgi:ParB family chromosome partitioning protein